MELNFPTPSLPLPPVGPGLRFPTQRNLRRKAKRAKKTSSKYPEWLPLIGDVAPTWWVDFSSGLYWFNAIEPDFNTWLTAIQGTFSRSSIAYYTNSVGLLTQAQSGVIRFDYDPVALTPKGLLLEGTSTNLLLQSNTFSNASWTQNQLQAAPAQTGTGPDGATSAWTITPNAVNAQNHGVFQLWTGTAATYTYSVYVKANGYSKCALYENQSQNAWATFNLSTGTVIDNAGGNVTGTSIIRLANGWFRVSMTFTAAAATQAFIIEALDNGYTSGSPNTYLFVGDTTSGILAFGAQIELASFASSYIPTTSSTATRAADSLTATPISSWYNATNGVLYAAADSARIASNGGIASIDDVAENNGFELYAAQSAALGRIISGGSVVFQATVASSGQTTYTPNVLSRAAISAAANNFVYDRDANPTTVTGSSGAMPVSPTVLSIGSVAGGAAPIYGHINQIGYWPTTATGAQLQSLTSPASWVPTAVGVLPSIFADFAGGNYMFNGYVQPSLSTWESQIGATFARASNGTFTGSSGLLQTASSNVLRFDYDPVALTPKGLLLEGSSTNLLLHSGLDLINTNFVIQHGTATSNAVTGPDGTVDAATFIADNTNNPHDIVSTVNTINVTNGQTYVVSIYIKPVAALQWVSLRLDASGTGSFSGNAYCYFDIINGVQGTLGAAASSAAITKFSNGWFRISVVAAATGTTTAGPVLYTSSADNLGVSPSYTGNNVDGYAAWGWQFENLGFASSYTATTTATVTRAADVLNSTLSADNGSALTVYQKFDYEGLNSGSGNSLLAGSAASSFEWENFILSSNSHLGAYQNDSNVADVGATSANTVYKFGATFSATVATASLDGGTVATSSAVSRAASTQLNIGGDFNGGNALSGHIAQLGLWPVIATNAQLQTLTT